MTNSDRMVQVQSNNSNAEKKDTVIDHDVFIDGTSGRDPYSHHHEGQIEMGDREEHRPSKVVTDDTNMVETDHEVSKEKQADASVYYHEGGDLYA